MRKHLPLLPMLASTGIALAVLTTTKDAKAVGFFAEGQVSVGPGFYHYFSGGGIANAQDWGGFSWHINACAGLKFGDSVGVGVSAMFTPLLNAANGGVAFAPGGYAGLCGVFEIVSHWRLEVTAGFGGMGASKIFGGIGPGWSAAISDSIVKLGPLAIDLGFRMLVGYGWEPDNSRHDPGLYLAPQVFAGVAFW